MRKKVYTAPEADVEKFTIAARVLTSGDNNVVLEDNENSGSGEYAESPF